MEERLRAAVESCLGLERGSILSSRPTSGGSINRAELVELRDGGRLFVKSNPAPLPGMFEREAEGLEALGAVGALRVPGGARAGGGTSGVVPFLVMEAVDVGARRPETMADFGRCFARLHRESRSDRYGFEHDNYIGSTPQPNAWSDDWCDFWRRHRLGFQLDLARRQGRSERSLDRLGDRLLDRLEEWLAEPEEPPCLLHGDLWGGNYLVDSAGEAVLIDPAAYYGRREADLAMTYVFGGFDGDFYAGYEEVWPLEPGKEERLEIYELYHLLNHLNLFGGGYLGSCLQILRRLVG